MDRRRQQEPNLSPTAKPILQPLTHPKECGRPEANGSQVKESDRSIPSLDVKPRPDMMRCGAQKRCEGE
jgi:hypothetical protein